MSWEIKGNEYVIVLAQCNSASKYIDSKPIRSIYFSHAFLRKMVCLRINNSFINTYVEIYDPKTQKTWYGEPGTVNYDAKKSLLLYPNKDSFGIWI